MNRGKCSVVKASLALAATAPSLLHSSAYSGLSASCFAEREKKTVTSPSLPKHNSITIWSAATNPHPWLLLFTCTTTLLQVVMHITAAAKATTTTGAASTAQQSNPYAQTKG